MDDATLGRIASPFISSLLGYNHGYQKADELGKAIRPFVLTPQSDIHPRALSIYLSLRSHNPSFQAPPAAADTLVRIGCSLLVCTLSLCP